MRNTGENEEHLGKMRYTLKSAAHLEKCTTLGKMHHPWKNAAHLEKCNTLCKMGLTWIHASPLEKSVVPLEKYST